MGRCEVLDIAPDYFSSEFRCCCSSMHVRQGTLIIGIIESICLLLFCATLCVFEMDVIRREVLEVLVLIAIAVLICLFFGLKKRESQLLLPYLIYQGMWILIYGLFIMFYFFVILDPGNKTGSIFLQPIFKVFGFDPKEHGINDFVFKSVEFIMVLCCTAISVWWFFVVYRCYSYFNEIAEDQESDTDSNYSVSLD